MQTQCGFVHKEEPDIARSRPLFWRLQLDLSGRFGIGILQTGQIVFGTTVDVALSADQYSQATHTQRNTRLLSQMIPQTFYRPNGEVVVQLLGISVDRRLQRLQIRCIRFGSWPASLCA